MGCAYSRTCIGEICAPREVKTREASQNDGAREFPVISPGSSKNVKEGEAGDELNQLSLTRDAEVGITRLSRVSAQFLPPDGSRTVKVPSGKYEMRYSYLSQRGYYPDALDKANQDSFCIHTPFGTSPDDHFFGVFDGHGEFGAQCSQFAKKKLCENLLRHGKFHEDAVEACRSSFLTTNSQLHADILDDTMSGTTAITILVRGRTLCIANSGDSRAVIAERRGKDVVAVDLSMDQTPFREDECERVMLCGAQVMTLDQIEGLKNPEVKCWGDEEGDDGDPPRLWVPNGMYPGTAFTRSIGDSIAETIGVVATPEIVVLELTPNHPFFVLASDGVFEFLSSQTVVDMVAKYKDPRDACAAIVAESYRLWLQYETRTDDITVIVVHVNGLTEAAGTRLACPGGIICSPVPQVVEVTGTESPSTLSWSGRNHRTRNDLSKARLRAIESSLENEQIWAPPSPLNRKTWEEEAHIERALHDHFLFRKLTDSQCHVLLDSMQRVEVQPGDVVVEQGGEGDCFYVVGSGEFEVSATQEDKNGETTRVLQQYTAEKLSSFGELALMYNKPLQASVRAVTRGTLWALKREDFRRILMSEFSNLSSLKLLRSVDLLSKLTILQLSQITDSLSEVSFSDGQSLFDKDEGPRGLYIVRKGSVRFTFKADAVKSPNVCSLKRDDLKSNGGLPNEKEILMEKSEGSYFGEWVLLGEQLSSLTAVAVGDVTCALLTKENFDSVVGPLAKLSQGNEKETNLSLDGHNESMGSTLAPRIEKVDISGLEWKRCLHTTDYCEIGLVSVGESENYLTLKRFSKHKVKQLAKEEQVLKEKTLMKNLNPLVFVPRIIHTCADNTHACILLNTCLACSLSSILHKPLDDASAKFIAACVVLALEDLHESGILFRGVSADVLMLDKAGYLQIVDFRFGKAMPGERTFTICGMADFLAPEIVQGKGHGFPADWWALGVLTYRMLRGELPFGSWRQNELDTVAKISKGQVLLPETFAPDAADFITKLLDVDESKRLGSVGGSGLVKGHPWFNGVDWKEIEDRHFPVPPEITSRMARHMGSSILEECAVPPASPSRDLEELSVPEWLEDW